jgi:hypothetical protein
MFSKTSELEFLKGRKAGLCPAKLGFLSYVSFPQKMDYPQS